LTRPVYETSHDRANEKSVADILSIAWKCRTCQVPRFYPCDLVAYRNGQAKALIEIKRRRIVRGKYPTLHIGLNKVTHLYSLSVVSGLPAFIVAALDDAVLAHKVTPPYGVVSGGRFDRNDKDDQEPVCEIDFNDFILVAEL